MARGLPPAESSIVEDTSPVIQEAVTPDPDPQVLPAAVVPSQPLILARTPSEPRAYARQQPSSPTDLTQREVAPGELSAVAVAHVGIALPPAPLMRPAAAGEAAAQEPAASSSGLLSPAESEVETEATDRVIAPTFPVSRPIDFPLDAINTAAKTVPFRVPRPAPPLVRPQHPQTVNGAIAALREAGMDSGVVPAARAPRLSSPSQSTPSGPAFQRAAPQLAGNGPARHQVAPLRRPDLSSYYSKDMGDLSDPVAPRGRNREARTPPDRKRQA
jgi:hypothetical protein